MIGGDANGVLFKDWCWESWKSKYGTSPPWRNKEFSQLADARARLDTEQLAREAWDAFMKSTEDFHEGHSPGQFLFSLSKMTARAVKAIPKKQVRVEGEAVSAALKRAGLMAKIYAEVERDPSIPEAEKKNEASRRCREMTP